MFTRNVAICHGTKRVPSPQLVDRGRYHVTMMSGNPAFPGPQPSLAEVTQACDQLDLFSQTYQFTRGRLDLAARNEAHAHLRMLIISLAAYVQTTCGGDRGTALSAGFETKRKRSPSEPMTAPGDVRASRTAYPGTIDLRWAAVKHRKIYAVYYTDGDPGQPEGWTLLLHTSKNYCTVTELVSDVQYTFRITALGAQGEGPVSDIAVAKAA